MELTFEHLPSGVIHIYQGLPNADFSEKKFVGRIENGRIEFAYPISMTANDVTRLNKEANPFTQTELLCLMHDTAHDIGRIAMQEALINKKMEPNRLISKHIEVITQSRKDLTDKLDKFYTTNKPKITTKKS